MTIVSIDFSILYPGICICRDFKDFSWLAVVNSKITKKHRKNLDDLVIKYPKIEILYTETKRKKDEQYYLTERTKLINYLETINLIISNLKNSIDDPKNVIFVLEGMSFGSSGNSLVDLAQATGILKERIVEDLLDGDNDRLFIFSPGELKNAIECKGNASKLEVCDAFKEDPILKATKSSDLHKALISEEEWIINDKGIVASPIMDMIDSYLGIIKIFKILNES